MVDSKNVVKFVKPIATSALATFPKIADAAQHQLRQAGSSSGPEVFADINTFTSPNILREQSRIYDENRKALIILSREPAIARVVAIDENNERNVFFICRATPVNIVEEGSFVVSYRSPVGRLASLPIGDELVFTRNGKTTQYEVVEKAQFRTYLSAQGWDSQNSVLENEDFGILTVESLRSILEQDIFKDVDAELLDRLLAEESTSANVQEGLHRNVIAKMELRDQPILDRYQDEIFRLPLNSRLLLLGAPGTGKTTTLIRRLGQKLDLTALEEDEQKILNNIEGLDHKSSWIMFTPTELLKQYVKEAFAREGIPASDQRISTWSDYRRDLARNTFRFLKSASGRGSYVMKEAVVTFPQEVLLNQCAWFSDFDQWQKILFWEELRDAAKRLSENERKDVSRLGDQVLSIIEKELPKPSPRTFSLLTDIVSEIGEQIKSTRAEVDGEIRRALNLQVNRNQNFLDQMAAYMDGLVDVADDIDDQDVDDEEEIEQPRTRRAASTVAYMQAMRVQARAKTRRRPVKKSSRTGQLLEWIGERGLREEDQHIVGEKLLVLSGLRNLANPARRYVNSIPARYRRFRRLRQSEGRWYRKEGFSPTDIHPLEVDLILLAMLRSGNELVKLIRSLRDYDNASRSMLLRHQEIFRNQVLVDEATDFSPIQLGCMVAIALPEIRSFFACGDFNQRVTTWGTRSMEELKWTLPDIDTRSIVVAYRQSKQLHDLAKNMVLASDEVSVDAALPDYVNNEGVLPILAKNLIKEREIVKWLGERIREIERFVDQLPSIAVLVNSEEQVQSLSMNLSKELSEENIRVLPCPNGQVIGQDSDVRVFDVQHIKGLEFEAVFFIGLDRLAQSQPDVFDKYLYVGATRAATYFGLTCEQGFPKSLAGLERCFERNWR